MKNAHTHIVRIEKNGESVFRAEEDGTQDGFTDHSCLTVEKIVDFANTCDLADIEPTLQKQIDCNMQIAEEGLNNRWGVNVGKLYYENGKLLLGLRLQGSNPDLEKGRPVNLNVNLEEDIPALLTSLQLSDRVSETIRQRVQERMQKRKASAP